MSKRHNQAARARKRFGIVRLNAKGVHHILVPVIAFVILFGVIGVYLLVSSNAAAPSTTTAGSAAPASSTNLTWIINAHAITLLEGAGASKSLISTAFNNSHTYTTGTSATFGKRTISYDSYQSIRSAFLNHTLPGKYKAVMYDNEDWSGTPVIERRNPAKYEQLVGQLVHEHHMLYIATPATDIVRASGKLVSNNQYDTYVSRNIAGGAAQYADVIDLQAQGEETNLSAFTSFVKSATNQARAANPRVVVLVGLSTNPNGKAVSGQQLYAAYTASRDTAQGYWLNVPGSQSCPSCAEPQPQVGVYLLQQLY